MSMLADPNTLTELMPGDPSSPGYVGVIPGLGGGGGAPSEGVSRGAPLPTESVPTETAIATPGKITTTYGTGTIEPGGPSGPDPQNPGAAPAAPAYTPGSESPGQITIPVLVPTLAAPNVPTPATGTVTEDPALNALLGAYNATFGGATGAGGGGGGGSYYVTPVPGGDVTASASDSGATTRRFFGLLVLGGLGWLGYRWWKRRQGAAAAA